MLVENWKDVLARSYAAWCAYIGVFGPEVLQLVADNSDMLPWLDAGWKSLIRVTALVGVILLRPVKQKTLSGAPE